MFNGIEVDVLNLGDADCVIVTKWENGFAHRILIDGGCGENADVISEFLRQQNIGHFWAVICSHLHNDHARGLIKLIRNRVFTFSNGWMHDISKHVNPVALRRASAADDGVNQVVETTKELAAAFASRGITPLEPFAGMGIAAFPNMRVLGPSLPFYQKVIEEFTEVEIESPTFLPLGQPTSSPLWNAIALTLGGTNSIPRSGISGISTRLSQYPPVIPPITPLAGALKQSSVKKNPKTQPYNNTSVILGANFNGQKLLFPADAGSEALAFVTPDWNGLAYMGVPHHASDGNLSQGDIERFKPGIAFISAKGDSSHPSRAIVSGLVKIGAKVASTHKSGNLWFWIGTVPARTGYVQIEWLRGTGEPEPLIDWTTFLYGLK